LSHGALSGKYEFKEDQKQKHAGIFQGKFTLYWIQYSNGIVGRWHDGDEDGFKNNQYEGTWSEYGGKQVKKANWGERRIPDADFDRGEGEFGPDCKYIQYGWEDYSFRCPNTKFSPKK
jgi:hypothetical protein